MIRLSVASFAALLVIVAGPIGHASAQPILHIKDGTYKGSRQAGGHLAVQALAAVEKFPFAEIMADGNVRGWDEKNEALVLFLSTPEPDRFQVIALTTSKTPEEASRLGVAIVTHLATAKEDPKNPDRIAPKDGKLPARPTTLTWKSEERASTPIIRFFNTAAAIAMEKKGFGTQYDDKRAPVVFGATQERQMVAFLGRTAKSQTMGIHVVTATLGEDTSDKLATDVLSKIVNTLFE
jgi:hypothetical protein